MSGKSTTKLPPEKRHIVSVYIDELQDYLSLPTDLSDALAQARGLGWGSPSPTNIGISCPSPFAPGLTPTP